MSVVNVAFAGDMDESKAAILAEKLKKEIEATGKFSIGILETATSKDEVGKLVISNKFDCIICQDGIRDAAIGAGSIKKWKKDNPSIKIILLVNESKRHGEKLRSLLLQAHYYNALYLQEASGENIASLMEADRTREEAAVYYGFDKDMKEENIGEAIDKMAADMNVESIQGNVQNTTEASAAVDEQIPPVKQPEEAKREKETVTEERKKEDISENIEAAADSFNSMLSGEIPQNDSSDFSDSKKDAADDRNEFADDALFNAEDWMAFTSFAQTPQAENQTERKDEPAKEQLSSERKTASYQETPNTFSPAVAGQRDIFAPITAVILSVLSDNAMLVRFDKELSLEHGTDIENYRMIFYINSGSKGHVSGNRFVKGTANVTAYGNSLVDSYTAVVETPDTDLTAIGFDVQDKQCKILMFRI